LPLAGFALFRGMMKFPVVSVAALSLTLLAKVHGAEAPLRLWNEDVIYFAVTDRFHDGDPENNQPPDSDPVIFDGAQKDNDKYHGGDLRGLELALQSGYFKDLGVTAIWITPPVRNVWYSKYDMSGPKTGYHGYWTQDFLDIDPHLVSRRSLDGSRTYPDTRDGRMQHYKDFVTLAHSQGIKIVQDIVCNHAGPVFYYDTNGNDRFDVERREEWIAPFKRTGYFENARWFDIPRWDLHRAAPDGPVTILGRAVPTRGVFGKLETYGRKGMSRESLGKNDGEEIECDFFGLRDFWTAPGGAQFDELVNDFVEVYAFYLEDVGVDGFRIDTIKHVHHAFWDAFSERLRKRLGSERAKRLILFGEVYDGSAAKVGGYTYRSDWPQRAEPCLDSVLHFPFCFAVRAYLRTKDAPFGKSWAVEKAWRDLFSEEHEEQRALYNPTPGLDGLNARRKVVNFVENHDSLNRFRVQAISERRNQLANALLLLAPGIPCLYYGSETDLEDARAKVGDETETGRLTFVPRGKTDRLNEARRSHGFKAIAALNALRRELPALVSSAVMSLWSDSSSADSDDGVFAFARGGDGIEPVLIVFNASNKERVTGIPGQAMYLVSPAGKPLIKRGDKLVRVPIAGLDAEGAAANLPFEVEWKDDFPQVELHVAAESVNLYRIAR
jgi:glycosidase